MERRLSLHVVWLLFLLILLPGCIRFESADSPPEFGLAAINLSKGPLSNWIDVQATRPATCAGQENVNSLDNCPPLTPQSPFPTNGATAVAVNTELSWTGGDPDGDRLVYRVLMGAGEQAPTEVCNDTPAPLCDPAGDLQYDTQYQWQAIAADAHGITSAGPRWTFTTEPEPLRTLLEDDFSDDLAWDDQARGLVQRDESNERLAWRIPRGTTVRYYIPVDAAAHDIELSFRVLLEGAGGNAGAFIGLVEDLDGALEDSFFPTGFFLQIIDDTQQVIYLHQHITYHDRAFDTFETPEGCIDIKCVDPASYLDLGSRNVWRTVNLSIHNGEWTAYLFDEQGRELDRVAGTMSGSHEQYRCLMLFGGGNGGWEWLSGVLDDVAVMGLPAE